MNTHFLTAKAQKAKKEGKTEGCGHQKRIPLIRLIRLCGEFFSLWVKFSRLPPPRAGSWVVDFIGFFSVLEI
jgi:hypothetical protein